MALYGLAWRVRGIGVEISGVGTETSGFGFQGDDFLIGSYASSYWD